MKKAANKPTTGAASKSPRFVVEAPGSKPRSIVRILSERRGNRELLFGAVADSIRSCRLDPDEADVIAKWFERMRDGEKPADVLLGERRGRRKGATGGKFIKGETVHLPDHVDLTWRMRQAIAFGHAPEVVFNSIAEMYGVTAAHVAEIYATHVGTLADDPTIAK